MNAPIQSSSPSSSSPNVGGGPVIDLAIIGAGIGGLSTALALHAQGIACTVFESVDALRPLGVGINLLPHSVRVLAGLGLQERLAQTAIETAALSYFNKHGQLIWSEPRGVAAGYAYPQFSIHRGELQMLLLEATRARLGADAVRAGHVLTRFEDQGDAVLLQFTDSQGVARPPVRARAVIGADGIHSVVRRAFHPDEGPPRFSGYLLWRGCIEGEAFLGGRTMAQIGHKNQKFVTYPISRPLHDQGRAMVNWIAELPVGGDTPPRQDWSRKVDAAIFRAPFAGWRFPWLDIPSLIDRTDAIFEYPMADRDPLDRWTYGRVTLLGDAAHPMYPIGSNGASQSILDAEAMAQALAATGFGRDTLDPVGGFAQYEGARREATAGIVLGNRAGGPDEVMELAERRAPQGFSDIHEVIPRAELEAISARYKQLAGFSKAQVNRN